MKRTEKNKSIKDRLTYAYIRRIKKWMFCPACQDGKMAIDKGSTMWTCEECGYKLSADEFEDDYVFWFCDECQTYLNNQEEFDRKSQKHICKKCGYENDTSFSNIKGECLDCGKIISDPDATLCIDCKQIRKEKAKEWLKNAGKIVGVAAAVAGTIYLASRPSDEDENMGYKYIPDKDDKEGDSMSERFPGIDWFCDRCNACLSDQDGFDDHKYTWKCTECGHKNSISSDDIYESEEDFRNPNKK